MVAQWVGAMVCEMVARLAHEWERMRGRWMVEHSVATLDDSKVYEWERKLAERMVVELAERMVAMLEIHWAVTSERRLAAKKDMRRVGAKVER